jgi:peptidoglycan-N-acetylmuramic acid deacetylase
MKKTITLLVIIAAVGCVLLFTGCEPNVRHEGIGENDRHLAPIETTPRNNTTTTPPPHGTVYPDRNHEIDDEAAVGNNPTAFTFTIQELNAIGWGLGRAVDDKNRPLDALNAQSKYGHLGAIFIDEKTDNRIYLTFDEGYENGFSPRILDVLREKGVRATFFVTYDYCKNEPELVRRMLADGHELGNHSWSHPSFPGLTDAQIAEEITKLHDYVAENFGYEMRLIRFPMGEFCERVLAATQQLGYKSVFWSFAYLDWNVNSQPSPSEALAKIKAGTHPGAVILLHAVSCTNAEILGDVLDYWHGQGLKLGLFE